MSRMLKTTTLKPKKGKLKPKMQQSDLPNSRHRRAFPLLINETFGSCSPGQLCWVLVKTLMINTYKKYAMTAPLSVHVALQKPIKSLFAEVI